LYCRIRQIIPRRKAKAIESDALGDSSAGPETLNGVAIWLLRSGWRYTNYRLLFEEIARRLVASGVPLWRMGAYIPTIDPEVFGDAFVWKRSDKRARYLKPGYTLLNDEEFKNSPLHEVARSERPLRRRLEGPQAQFDYPLMRELRAKARPITSRSPCPSSTVRLCRSHSRPVARAGSPKTTSARFRIWALVLARVAEGFAIRMRVERLLNTCLGRDAGKRVLAGQILRGSGETIEAVILFTDLRGFTALSERLAPAAVLALPNAYFNLVGKAVKAEQGESLNFHGDGVMAVFPVAEERPMTAAVESSLNAASKIDSAFDAWNAERPRARQGNHWVWHRSARRTGHVRQCRGLRPTRFHRHRPCSQCRLNRLQTLCRELSQTVVLSQEIARHAPARCRSLGRHSMRGIALEQEVLAPADDVRSSATPAR